MANTKSAIKRIKVTQKNTLINKRAKTKIKTSIKKFQQSLVTGNAEVSTQLAVTAQQAIDKAWKKGALHKNTASRKKSALMKKLNSIIPG